MNMLAVVAKRSTTRTDESKALEKAEIESMRLSILYIFPYGILIEGNESEMLKLEALNYRVKAYRHTNLLKVGDYTIDTKGPPVAIPKGLSVPADLADAWTHHLVLLNGPRDAGWLNDISQVVDEIVEPISAYGLFVIATPRQMDAVKQLPFVAWSGPFQPAYRIHRNLNQRKGRLRFVSILVYPPTESVSVVKTIALSNGVIRTALRPDRNLLVCQEFVG
jgi:hypothetical protein